MASMDIQFDFATHTLTTWLREAETVENLELVKKTNTQGVLPYKKNGVLLITLGTDY